MPPSVDSTCTPSACLTRSTPKKRNSCFSKEPTEDLHKKSRGSSSLSETSPRRSGNVDQMMGQLTQESRKIRSSPDNDPYVHLDMVSDRPQQGFFPLAQKKDGFSKQVPFDKEGRRSSEDLHGSVKSMIVQSARLARSILVAYEKEGNEKNLGSSAILTELAQQRTFNETVATELARLRASYEYATLELSQLRISKEADAAEVANLQLENANLLTKEAAASSKLDELRRQCAVNIVATFVMSKALMLQEQAELIDEMEANINSANHDILCRLDAANEEVKQVRLSTEALLRENDEAATGTAQVVAVELREMQTAREIAVGQIESMKSTLESTTASLKKVFLENDEITREKLESESRREREVIQLQSEKAALVREHEKTSASAVREFNILRSRFGNAVENLEIIRHAAGVEKEKLQSEINAKTSMLDGLKKKLVEVQANMAARDAERATEVVRLSKEKEELHAREAALLEKLHAITNLPRPHGEMHLAFLINCGLIRSEDYNLSFISRDCS